MKHPTRRLAIALLLIASTAFTRDASADAGEPSAAVDRSAVDALKPDLSLGHTTHRRSGRPRLQLISHSGALRIFPPYPSPIDPFSTPWADVEDRFGLAGAFDVWQSEHWRVGVQVEGIYTRHGLTSGAPYHGRWRRRVVIYGTFPGGVGEFTIGVVIHDTGPPDPIARAASPGTRGAWVALAEDLARRQTGKTQPRPTKKPARDRRNVRPQDDILVLPATDESRGWAAEARKRDRALQASTAIGVPNATGSGR